MLAKAILVTSVLGTSSAALAHPNDGYTYGHGPVARGQRYDSGYWRAKEREREAREARERFLREQREWRARWTRERWRPVVVTTPAVTVDPGYAYVPPRELALVGATSLDARIDLDVCNRLAGRTAMHIEARGVGRTYVDRVILRYADGGSQAMELDRYLDAGQAPIRLGLGDGAAVTRIVVEGHSEYGGTIAIDAT